LKAHELTAHSTCITGLVRDAKPSEGKYIFLSDERAEKKKPTLMYYEKVLQSIYINAYIRIKL
jgi:hypothetical protein